MGTSTCNRGVAQSVALTAVSREQHGVSCRPALDGQ
jgi:hypothetical protein